MKTLVISKAHGDHIIGSHFLECQMTDTKDFEEYRQHPNIIVLAGRQYQKNGWNNARKTVHYI